MAAAKRMADQMSEAIVIFAVLFGAAIGFLIVAGAVIYDRYLDKRTPTQ